MKSDREGTGKRKEREHSVKRAPEKKKPVKKLVTGRTEIMDFDLQESLAEQERGKQTKKREQSVKKREQPVPCEKAQKKSKAAVKERAGHPQKHTNTSGKPSRVTDETAELLDAELLSVRKKAVSEKKRDDYMDFKPKKVSAAKEKSAPASSHTRADHKYKENAAERIREDRPSSSGRKTSGRRKQPQSAPAGKKRSGGFFEDFTAMDMIVAGTGVLVLLVAIVTIGMYSSASSIKKQVAQVAAIGEKMENVGIAGEGVFTAVADARIAAQEAADLPEMESSEEYEEKELTSEVSLGLKLTSVQRDLKIKFTNKNTGKLIANQPFEVKIEGPQTLTKTDDDRDGIIYIKDIAAGEYTVTVTAPDEIDGSRAAGVSSIVTVKDKIEYKKIDITDEVKKESEINAAKEDTAVHTQVESTLKDTVEWVESTKIPLDGGENISYEEIKKEDIPDPSSTASLDFMRLAGRLPVPAAVGSAAGTEKEAAGKRLFGRARPVMLENMVMPVGEVTPGTEGGEGENNGNSESSESESESKPPARPEVKKVEISGRSSAKVGETVTLTADVTMSDNSTYGGSIEWSNADNGKVTGSKAGPVTVTATADGVKSNEFTVTFEEDKPAQAVEKVEVSADKTTAKTGETINLTANITMNTGSYDGEVKWSSGGVGKLKTNGGTATFEGTGAGDATITAEAGGKSGSIKLTFADEVKKVDKLTIPDTVTIAVGGSVKLSLTVSPSDAKDQSADWSSDKTDVATVDGSGNVKGVKAGTAKITAKAKDGSGVVSNTCTVTVSANLGVSLEDPGSMRVGEEKQMNCTASGDIASTEWSVSDTKLATIDKEKGKVKALKEGKVNVTVKVKDKSGKEATATGELTINSKASVKLDPQKAALKVNEKKTIKAEVDTNGNKAVEWKSKDESIAKIVETKDNRCVVQALKPGKVSIVATSKEDKEKTAECEITVTLKDSDTPLKDKNGNQLYYKDGDKYKAATIADYYKYDKFYRQKDNSRYQYTGWQTIDGKRYFFDKNGNPVTGDQVIQGMKYSFNSDGSLKVNSTMGIDVSKHNGGIDWNAVKNSGVDFAIIRCGYRGSATGVLVEDPRFQANIQAATAAGLKVGVYFFSQAVNEVEAVEEASMTASLIKKYKITYPVFMDVEGANGRADGMDAGTRTQVIKAFCQTIANSGYTAGVYANKSWLTSRFNPGALGSYKIWLAQYAAVPTYGGRYDMWQYSSKGRISGMNGDVDLNISYLGY